MREESRELVVSDGTPMAPASMGPHICAATEICSHLLPQRWEQPQWDEARLTPLSCAARLPFLCLSAPGSLHPQDPGMFSPANPHPPLSTTVFGIQLPSIQIRALLTSLGLSFLSCKMGTIGVSVSEVGEDP